MSIRFFEKIQKDVHNAWMTDRHQAQSYPLRMPQELKEKMVESAKASGRSLHAEIVHRLEASFDDIQGSSDELLELLRKTIQSQETTILMLQAYMVDVINSLPPKQRTDERIRVASNFVLELAPDDEPPPGQVQLPLSAEPPRNRVQVSVRKTRDGRLNPDFSAEPEVGDVDLRKVVIVGNPGREGKSRDSLPILANLDPPKPPNKGPTRSPNARIKVK